MIEGEAVAQGSVIETNERRSEIERLIFEGRLSYHFIVLVTHVQSLLVCEEGEKCREGGNDGSEICPAGLDCLQQFLGRISCDLLEGVRIVCPYSRRTVHRRP
ncbi:hypothetical protein PMAYCL1PPCAC_03748 [Pristionchus mayeri]|uniref:Uncharacterized protein n=1 Tax=Pristionchus mayeri TaxID=1317129 RepID=A0AAN4Z7R4_9BILA|nr:hypothetical protein PMAYCL1PPCAC_03748 [Pristionchus mayeri]